MLSQACPTCSIKTTWLEPVCPIPMSRRGRGGRGGDKGTRPGSFFSVSLKFTGQEGRDPDEECICVIVKLDCLRARVHLRSGLRPRNVSGTYTAEKDSNHAFDESKSPEMAYYYVLSLKHRAVRGFRNRQTSTLLRLSRTLLRLLQKQFKFRSGHLLQELHSFLPRLHILRLIHLPTASMFIDSILDFPR